MIKGLRYKKFSFSQPSSNSKDDNLEKEVAFVKKHSLKRMFIRKRNVLFIESCRYAKEATQKRWGINFIFFDYGDEGLIKQVFQTNNLNKEAARLWWKKIQKNPKFAKNIVKELEEIVEVDRRIVKKLLFKKRKWSKNDLIDVLNLYLSWFSQFFEIVYPWFAIDEMKDKIMEPWIKKEYKNKASNILNKILKPTKLPLSSLEQMDLLKISKMKGGKREENLRKHKREYDFLAVHQLEDAPFDLKYYQSRLKTLKNLSEYEKNKNNFKIVQEEIGEANKLQKKLNFPRKYEDLLFLIRSFAYLRTNTIDNMMMVYKSFQRPFRIIAKKLGVSLDELTFLTLFEIREGLDKNIRLKSVARNRMKKGYLYFIGSQRPYLFEGKEGVQVFDKFKKFTDVTQEKTKVIKGVTAFEGKEKGNAHVVLDRRKANELKKGEILVTTMTSPDFVPAMKRAKAIVTNEGGVLCHAAIMARELRKPCVIGTKIATDLIKSGDLIEVDAEKGTVKILEKI